MKKYVDVKISREFYEGETESIKNYNIDFTRYTLGKNGVKNIEFKDSIESEYNEDKSIKTYLEFRDSDPTKIYKSIENEVIDKDDYFSEVYICDNIMDRGYRTNKHHKKYYTMINNKRCIISLITNSHLYNYRYDENGNLIGIIKKDYANNVGSHKKVIFRAEYDENNRRLFAYVYNTSKRMTTEITTRSNFYECNNICNEKIEKIYKTESDEYCRDTETKRLLIDNIYDGNKIYTKVYSQIDHLNRYYCKDYESVTEIDKTVDDIGNVNIDTIHIRYNNISTLFSNNDEQNEVIKKFDEYGTLIYKKDLTNSCFKDYTNCYEKEMEYEYDTTTGYSKTRDTFRNYISDRNTEIEKPTKIKDKTLIQDTIKNVDILSDGSKVVTTEVFTFENNNENTKLNRIGKYDTKISFEYDANENPKTVNIDYTNKDEKRIHNIINFEYENSILNKITIELEGTYRVVIDEIEDMLKKYAPKILFRDINNYKEDRYDFIIK